MLLIYHQEPITRTYRYGLLIPSICMYTLCTSCLLHCRYLECGPVYWIAFFTQFSVVALDPESIRVKKERGRLRARKEGLREIALKVDSVCESFFSLGTFHKNCAQSIFRRFSLCIWSEVICHTDNTNTVW